MTGRRCSARLQYGAVLYSAARQRTRRIRPRCWSTIRPTPSEPVEEWGFRDIERAVLQFAPALAELGLKRGDRVAIRLGNSSRSALLFFAAIAGGFIALPLSDQLTACELRWLLEDSGAACHRNV